MQHSVKEIGEKYQKLYKKREKKFDSSQFYIFALNHQKLYSLIKTFNDDFLVSTWHVDNLIADYVKTLKQ